MGLFAVWTQSYQHFVPIECHFELNLGTPFKFNTTVPISPLLIFGLMWAAIDRIVESQPEHYQIFPLVVELLSFKF